MYELWVQRYKKNPIYASFCEIYLHNSEKSCTFVADFIMEKCHKLHDQ